MHRAICSPEPNKLDLGHFGYGPQIVGRLVLRSVVSWLAAFNSLYETRANNAPWPPTIFKPYVWICIVPHCLWGMYNFKSMSIKSPHLCMLTSTTIFWSWAPQLCSSVCIIQMSLTASKRITGTHFATPKLPQEKLATAPN